MKRFKISFLAVLAVLAIGLTAATKSDVFKKPASAYVCQATTDFWKIFQNPLVTPPPIIGGLVIPLGNTLLPVRNTAATPLPQNDNTACPGDLNEACVISGEKPTTNITCNLPNNVFCCAQVLATPAPCGTISGGVDFRAYPIRVKLYCKAS